MATAPPILIWTPGGGVPVGPVSNPPVYSQAGTTALVEGQAYIDVVFGSIQTDDEWVLVECIVVNETDVDPLNIWPGIITDKAQAGFRLQLNGMPDSGDYYLHWAVSGVNIAPSPATLYTLTGPTSGPYDPIFSTQSSNFTVSLPPSTTLAGTLTVTPDDGGAGGTFTPATVTLTSSSASATFTYTPVSYGAKTISVTNSGTLTDPAGIVFTAVASTYTLSGPSSGAVSVASTNFTVALPVGGVVLATVTVTPGDSSGGGTFTPTTVNLTTGAPSATFTYTPASAGTKTISVTNNGGLTNPANLSYVSTAPFSPTDISGLLVWLKADSLALSDGAGVSLWTDSSGNGNNFGASSAPSYKTNIVNSKPVVRFDGPGPNESLSAIGASLISGNYTIMVVAAAADISAQGVWFNSGVVGASALYFLNNSGVFYHGHFSAPASPVTATEAGGIAVGVWNVLVTDWNGSNIHIWRNGTLKDTTGVTTIGNTGTRNYIGYGGTEGFGYYHGDIAEVLIYNSSLSATDRNNVTDFLKSKYAIA